MLEHVVDEQEEDMQELRNKVAKLKRELNPEPLFEKPLTTKALEDIQEDHLGRPNRVR